MTTGERIREAREALNLTQDDLAFRVRVESRGEVRTSPSELSRYERDKHTPRPELLVALASALGKSVDYFVGSAGEGVPSDPFRGGGGHDGRRGAARVGRVARPADDGDVKDAA